MKHRHHQPVVGHRFSIGAEHDGKLVGVAIVGRPVSRRTDQKFVAEVTRLCTDGTRNACSFLYGACARIAGALGFIQIQTFILEQETGSSLRAAGWEFDAHSKGGNWNQPSRQGRKTSQPQCRKQKWKRCL